MNYTLHQLEIFAKTAALGSVTKASEELYLTQPAVSIQLKKFQDQFEIPLFEVVGRRIFITDFGKEIAEAANQVLQQVSEINYKTLNYKNQIAGKLKIAIVSTAKYILPYFLSEFVNQNEGVDIAIDVTNKSSVIQSLENNETDFALVSTIPKHLKINKIPLMINQLHLVGGKQHQALKNRISIKKMEQLPYIYREPGSATRLAMERYMKKMGIQPKRKIELVSNEAVKQAVIAGLGYSIMPLIGIHKSIANKDLQIIPASGLPLQTEWNIIWLKSKNLNSAAKAYAAYVQEHRLEIIQQNFAHII